MDAYRFAYKYLQPFDVKENLIIANCPICHGGRNSDKKTFCMNRFTGTYMCQRGSCGAKGNFKQLLELVGEEEEPTTFNNNILTKAKKNYVLPQVDLNPLTEEILGYFAKRKISPQTLETYGISATESGDIFFPFWRDKILVAGKFRKPKKPQGKEAKEKGVKDMEPILFGMDTVDPTLGCLTITEGQIDTLSLYEAGVRNVVSVPCGCSNLDWIETCYDWLEQFGKIVIFGDNDPPGKKMRDQVVVRLDASRCYILDDDMYPLRPDGVPCKDANEILFFHGPEALLSVHAAASPVPVKGLLDLGDIIPVDPTTIPRIQTRIPDVDAFLGGLQEGGLTVFTGKPGEGKLLADDTPILTRNGWKNHGDLAVGDEVLSDKGEFVRVTHVFPKHVANMKVTFNNGEVIRCHENHEWILQDTVHHPETTRILSAKEVYEKMNTTKVRYRIPRRCPIKGETKTFEDCPYSLGERIGIGEYFSDDIATLNKSLTASVEQRLEVLAGLMDSFGFRDHGKERYLFSAIDEELMRGFIALINTFGWKTNVVATSEISFVMFCPDMVIPCRDIMMRNSPPLTDDEVFIASVEYCDPVPGNCISVEGGIYRAGLTMLPTHNSTLGGQICLSAIEQGWDVCAYSGELPKEKFQQWIFLQGAGSDYITLKYDPIRQINVPIVPFEVHQRIADWVRGHFFLFDNNEIFEANQSASILQVFTMAARRYGVKLFLVDNLMTALSDCDEETKAQTKFVNSLKKFAIQFNCHVIVVAHPRKTKAGEAIRGDDIGGSSATIRLADNAMVIEKPNIRLLKNRDSGVMKVVECAYCGDSRRIYQLDKGDLQRFGWNKEGLKKPSVLANSDPRYGIFLSEAPLVQPQPF